MVIKATCDREHLRDVLESLNRVVDRPLFGFSARCLQLTHVSALPYEPVECEFTIADVGGDAENRQLTHDTIVQLYETATLDGVEFTERP